MGTRGDRWAIALACLALACVSGRAAPGNLPQPADWVPARWPWSDPASLDLLSGGPVNCLLVRPFTAEFASAAAGRGLATLALVLPADDAPETTRRALAAGVTGIALEGDFPEAAIASVRQAAGGAPVVELALRSRMLRNSGAPVAATYQGVWPGVAVQENGAMRAGPSGSVWIDTNTGFLRAARASGGAPLWIAQQPPPKTLVTAGRYLVAIADAAMSGARWVLALDGDFSARLAARETRALADWRRMLDLVRYFERNPEWREMREYGKLALIQDPAKGGLISGGILDMIAAKNTPARIVPHERLTPDALKGASFAVDLDSGALTPAERDALRDFTRSGGTLLTAPPWWKDKAPAGNAITLDKTELGQLNDIFHELNSTVGRGNLGVRLFNASAMLSNFLISADGKTAILHLVNYSDYPVENITAQFLDDFHHAALLAPGSPERPLDLHRTNDGWEADIDKISVCATIKLER